MDDLFSSQEREIVKSEKVVVGLVHRYSFLTNLAWEMSLGSYWKHRASVKSLRESEVSTHARWRTRFSIGHEYGDISDITNKYVLAQVLILTNKNLILSYKKGLRQKKDFALVIPLDGLKSVQEKRMPRRNLTMKFETRGKEGKVLSFDILLMDLNDRRAWVDKLNQLILV